jgi:hypothetical protein
MSRKIDLIRLDRIQDERMFICIETNNLYEINDIKIIDSEIWIQVPDGRVFKDDEILTVNESAEYYRFYKWMKHNLNIE